MKKLIATISTFVLIFMIPALFIGYLYNSNNNVTSQPTEKQGRPGKRRYPFKCSFKIDFYPERIGYQSSAGLQS